MYAQGIGKQSIAKTLNAEGILCPSEYKKLNGENYKNCNRLEKTSYWTYSTIKVMLQNELYIGNMVQGKKHQRMRSKQRPVEKENWIRVENTHEPIIDELISKDEFLSYREDYQQKETLYSKQIETLEEKKKESVTEDVFETPWLRRLLELKDIEELDRDIIVEMIDQITVYENRKLKISYNFGNELEHLFSSVYCEDLEKKAI